MSVALGEAILLQNHYGRRPGDAPAIATLFGKYLADIPAAEVVAGIESWIRKETTFPTPAEIRERFESKRSAEESQAWEKTKYVEFYKTIEGEERPKKAFRIFHNHLLQSDSGAGLWFEKTTHVEADGETLVIGLRHAVYADNIGSDRVKFLNGKISALAMPFNTIRVHVRTATTPP